jgi:Leucine-rich repeat (LRR) protein
VKGTKLTQDILKMLVQGFTHMKSLVVYKMKLSKEVFASNLLGHLTDLHIMECPEVTKHIGQMVKAAPQLTACTISKSKLTDEGCRGLLEGMKKLSFLDVSNNPITDLALYQFVQMESDLQELNISGCIDITDIGFGYAYSSLKKLKKITCLGCPEIIENKKAPSDPKIEVVFD